MDGLDSNPIFIAKLSNQKMRTATSFLVSSTPVHAFPSAYWASALNSSRRPLGPHNNFVTRSAFPMRAAVQSKETKASSIPNTVKRKPIPARRLIMVISSDVSTTIRPSMARLELMREFEFEAAGSGWSWSWSWKKELGLKRAG